MCVGKNAAPQVINYLNHQLLALFENASHCFESHGGKDYHEEHYSMYISSLFYISLYLNEMRNVQNILMLSHILNLVKLESR